MMVGLSSRINKFWTHEGWAALSLRISHAPANGMFDYPRMPAADQSSARDTRSTVQVLPNENLLEGF